jgi:hypothetical protein
MSKGFEVEGGSYPSSPRQGLHQDSVVNQWEGKAEIKSLGKRGETGGCTHKNTVCLRVSQLEGVAAPATEHNYLKKRMASVFILGRTIVRRKACSKLSETERATTRSE